MLGAIVPLPALALSFPKTLAAESALGNLAGRSWVVDPAFPMEYLGVSWRSGRAPFVRFLVDGQWTRWQRARADDDLPSLDGRTYSELVWTADADAYQVRGEDAGVEATAINTADGPRRVTWVTPAAAASHLNQPAVISRAAWGANESYRFDSSGKEIWPPAFYPTQKLIVHHTAGSNNLSQDYKATVRAIYYYHAVTRGWGDIGYNFLVDPYGNVYKGRWSGPAGTRDQNQDTPTGENAQGYGVTGAHVSGFNSGTMGIAVTGTYTDVNISAAARSALVDHLAWESEHHNLDPLGSSTYSNPVNGTQKFAPNISGHRDWAATECPGQAFYGELPQIRQDVATRVAAPPPAPTAPAAPSLSGTGGSSVVHLSWAVPSDGGSAITGYRIHRGSTSGGEALLTAVGNVTSYDDTGVTNGTTYFYQVTAVNDVGESARSNEVSATPRSTSVPGAPTLSATSASDKGVVLSWSIPSDGGSAITGYRIYRSRNPGQEVFLTYVSNVTSYQDRGTKRGTVYYYTVTAVNSVGEGPASNEASARAT